MSAEGVMVRSANPRAKFGDEDRFAKYEIQGQVELPLWLILVLGILTTAIGVGLLTIQPQAQKHGTSKEYRKCPLCAEVIKKEAVKCKHCGADLAAVDPEIQERLRKAQLIAIQAEIRSGRLDPRKGLSLIAISNLPPGRETELRKHYSNLSLVQWEELWDHIEELEPAEAEIARQERRRRNGLDPLGG